MAQYGWGSVQRSFAWREGSVNSAFWQHFAHTSVGLDAVQTRYLQIFFQSCILNTSESFWFMLSAEYVCSAGMFFWSTGGFCRQVLPQFLKQGTHSHRSSEHFSYFLCVDGCCVKTIFCVYVCNLGCTCSLVVFSLVWGWQFSTGRGCDKSNPSCSVQRWSLWVGNVVSNSKVVF